MPSQVDKISISIQAPVGQAARAAAQAAGVSFSSWVGAAIAARLRRENLVGALAALDETFGPTTAAELAEARSWYRNRKRVKVSQAARKRFERTLGAIPE
jgi:hypothetical protein